MTITTPRLQPRISSAPAAGAAVTSAVSQQGALVGQVIATLARSRRPVAATDGVAILRAVDRVLAGRSRRRSLTGARQAMALFAAAYLRSLWPPEGLKCAGAEVETATGGRLDLVWRGPGNEAAAPVLFDELKAQSLPPQLLLAGPTASQVERYLAAGTAEYGHRFVGLRLISLRRPAESLFIDPSGAVGPLGDSAFAGGSVR